MSWKLSRLPSGSHPQDVMFDLPLRFVLLLVGSIAISAAAAAAEPVANTLQLPVTDAVLANLPAHQLPSISLFAFDTQPAASDAACKIFPGDTDWPDDAVWALFDILTEGALIKTVPIGAVCYPTSGVYNTSACPDLGNAAQNGR